MVASYIQMFDCEDISTQAQGGPPMLWGRPHLAFLMVELPETYMVNEWKVEKHPGTIQPSTMQDGENSSGFSSFHYIQTDICFFNWCVESQTESASLIPSNHHFHLFSHLCCSKVPIKIISHHLTCPEQFFMTCATRISLFPVCSHAFPMVFPCFPMFSHGFPMLNPWFPTVFPWFPMFSHGFPRFPMVFLSHLDCRRPCCTPSRSGSTRCPALKPTAPVAWAKRPGPCWCWRQLGWCEQSVAATNLCWLVDWKDFNHRNMGIFLWK